jgi:hypothetical protein
VFRGIAHHHTKTAEARQNQKDPRNPRWHEIGEVINARGSPSERAPTLLFVPDEAISGVDDLVREQPGEPRDQEPKGWRHDAIVEAFRKTFERRSADTRRVKLARVATDDE